MIRNAWRKPQEMAIFYRTILLALALAVPLAASAQSPQDDDPPPATVEGAVINTQNSRTVPRATVTLFGMKGTGSKSTRADGNGHFIFEHVLPGRYKLLAEHTGFFSDDKKPGNQPVFDLAPAQYLKSVAVRLVPTAVISGEILDEYNDPVQNVEMNLLVMQARLGQMYLASASKTITDDRGQYRFAGLHPGKYYLVAEYRPKSSSTLDNAINTQIAEQMSDLVASRNRNASVKNSQTIQLNMEKYVPDAAFSYPALFYPDTNDFQQAQLLRLNPGDEIPANFILSSMPAVSISGRVTNGMTGAPPPAASVSAFWTEYMEGDGIPARTSAGNGEFTIHGVAPGTYILRTSFTDDKQNYIGEQIVEVGVQGAQNVVIAAVPDFNAAGHVTVIADARQNPISRVSILFAGEGTMPRVAVRAAMPDMKFDAQLRPERKYHATVPNLPEDYYLKSVAISGHQVDPGNILVEGQRGEIELTVSAAGGHIDGTLLDAGGQPTRGSILLVTDISEPGPADLFRRTTADSKGKFTLRGVAPGNYRLVAVDLLNLETEISAPEFQRSIGNRGQSLTVEENGKYTIVVKLDSQ